LTNTDSAELIASEASNLFISEKLDGILDWAACYPSKLPAKPEQLGKIKLEKRYFIRMIK
jgi:hypothetical protein